MDNTVLGQPPAGHRLLSGKLERILSKFPSPADLRTSRSAAAELGRPLVTMTLVSPLPLPHAPGARVDPAPDP